MIWSAERLISESFNGVCEGIDFDFVSGLDIKFVLETLVPSGQNNTPRGRCFVAEGIGGEATFFTIGWKDFFGPISGSSLLRARLSVLINIPSGRCNDALGMGAEWGKTNGFIFSFTRNDFEFASGRVFLNPTAVLIRIPSGGGAWVFIALWRWSDGMLLGDGIDAGIGEISTPRGRAT